jgi:hypothetical protein
MFFGPVSHQGLPFFLPRAATVPFHCALIFRTEQSGGIFPHFVIPSISQLSNGPSSCQTGIPKIWAIKSQFCTAIYSSVLYWWRDVTKDRQTSRIPHFSQAPWVTQNYRGVPATAEFQCAITSHTLVICSYIKINRTKRMLYFQDCRCDEIHLHFQLHTDNIFSELPPGGLFHMPSD